jgi:Ca2+-binding EF-hand superfamily protein
MEECIMRRIVARVILAAALLSLLIGPAVAQSPVPPNLHERFQAFDKNQDGLIDRAEFQVWMVDAFYQRDKAHKGYLAYDDVKDVMSAEKFKIYDRSGDGKIILREFLNATFQDFAAADTAQRGALTVEEIETYIKRGDK